MHIQSKEEAAAYTPLRGSRNTKVIALLAQLQVGEALVVNRADWKGRQSPFRLVNNFGKRHHRQFDKAYTNDGRGWWIQRTA